MKPFVYTTVRLLSLASQGTIDQKILSSLVGANQIDLILEGGGLVELGREPVWSRPPELGHDAVGPVHQSLNKVLPISWLEMSTVCEIKKQNDKY